MAVLSAYFARGRRRLLQVIPNLLIPGLLIGALSRSWRVGMLAVVGLGLIWGFLIAVSVSGDFFSAALVGGANVAVGAAISLAFRYPALCFARHRAHPSA